MYQLLEGRGATLNRVLLKSILSLTIVKKILQEFSKLFFRSFLELTCDTKPQPRLILYELNVFRPDVERVIVTLSTKHLVKCYQIDQAGKVEL